MQVLRVFISHSSVSDVAINLTSSTFPFTRQGRWVRGLSSTHLSDVSIPGAKQITRHGVWYPGVSDLSSPGNLTHYKCHVICRWRHQRIPPAEATGSLFQDNECYKTFWTSVGDILNCRWSMTTEIGARKLRPQLAGPSIDEPPVPLLRNVFPRLHDYFS